MDISDKQLEELCCAFARIHWHKARSDENDAATYYTSAKEGFSEFKKSSLFQDIIENHEANFNL